jgi:hypothetical protein
LRAALEEFAGKATSAHQADCVLSDKESKLELDEPSNIADAQTIEIIALKAQAEANATALQEAQRALLGKESMLSKLMGELNERSSSRTLRKLRSSHSRLRLRRMPPLSMQPSAPCPTRNRR